jgi:putative transcriptional regulator
MAKEYVIRDSLTGRDIKNIREILSMTQKEFADFANCSVRTVENWESKSEKITGPVVTLIEILLRKPEYAKKLALPKDRLKVRLYYMFRDMVCTIIDVDELSQEVIIHNYIDDPIYRAFGVNTEPDFEDYREFLESRCFPRTRDKIEFELKRLDIPFYEPMMIIRKTQGRMAGDDFWIRIE